MEIMRDDSIKDWLISEIQTSFSSQRDGIHLTDVLYPRKKYFSEIVPKKVSEKESLYFLAGRGHEDALSRISGLKKAESLEWQGIIYSCDFYESMPIEFKTRRRKLANQGEETTTYDTYISQLRGYCAITDKQQGWLWVLSLVEMQADRTTKPELVCYKLLFSKEELEEERKNLLILKEKLIESISCKNYLILPLCPSWMCGKKTYEVIKKPFCVDCDKEFASESNIKKHAELKKHAVKSGEYKDIYEVSCKWYNDCIGQTTVHQVDNRRLNE